jgi:hypothetical protein
VTGDMNLEAWPTAKIEPTLGADKPRGGRQFLDCVVARSI